MTDEKKQSYTDKLVYRLRLVGVSESIITSIKDISLEMYEERQKEQDLNFETYTFGKYKGKTFKAVAALDDRYILWTNKNNKYLCDKSKDIVADLCKNIK
jgi:uncharacterized protein (DUF3820 family)